MPLRIKPAPRAASQPITTLTQLVPRSSTDAAYAGPRSARTSLILRGADSSCLSACTSRSSTFGASVLPSLSLTCLLLPSKANETMPARPGGLRRYLLDRLDFGGQIVNEERLGIDGESYPALLAGVVPLRDLQRPLDALGLYHYLETGGAAAHLDRDSYHLPASLVSAPTARQSKPFLLQLDNERINKRRQFVESHNSRRSTARGRTSEKEHLCSKGFARVPLTKRDPDLVF